MMRIISIPTMIQMKQIATALFLLLSTTVSAQKVVVNGNYVVIDNRNLPATAITSTAKPIATPTTVTEGSPQNREVYHYFAVSKEANNGNSLATWENAINVCPNYDSGDGAGRWRMPTQRELMLMWILRDKLETAGVVSFSNGGFWSGTMNALGSSWKLEFGNGQMSAQTHFTGSPATPTTLRVRCVRDLAP